MDLSGSPDGLSRIGRAVEVEPFRAHPRWALAQAIATAAAVVGSVIGVDAPGLGLAMVLAAALVSSVEATGAASVLQRALGGRDASNVWSPPDDRARGLLIVVASEDAPPDALLPRLALQDRDPWLAIGGSMLLILACCALRLLGFEGNGLTAVQFLPTLVLLVATVLLVDAELSEPSSGDPEAAGAAAAVALADELRGDLRYLDVAVLIAAARVPFAQGMRAWLRRHREEIDPDRTVVLAIGALGSGGVRWTRREGPWLLSWKTSSDLTELCADIAEDDADGAAFDARAVTSRRVGNAVAALSRGIPAIGVTTADPLRVEPQAACRGRAFCAELARRIDSELAPRLDEEPLRPA